MLDSMAEIVLDVVVVCCRSMASILRRRKVLEELSRARQGSSMNAFVCCFEGGAELVDEVLQGVGAQSR